MKSFKTKKWQILAGKKVGILSPTLLANRSGRKSWISRLLNTVFQIISPKRLHRKFKPIISGTILIFLAITIVFQMTASASWLTINETDWSGIDPANVDNLVTSTVGELSVGSRLNSEDWCDTASCDNSFGYRKQITINNSGDASSNTSVEVLVEYDEAMRSDFGDLRFVSEDKLVGESIVKGSDLSYFFTNKIDSTSARVGVIVPELENGKQNIYVYFGNSDATSLSIIVERKTISASNGYTCAIASDDLAYCWGRNYYGELGNNSTTHSKVPVAVNTAGVLSGKTIKSITAGYYHTCAIASDDQAYCWGYNNNGQLGNDSTTNSKVPVTVNTAGVLNGKTIKAISAGYGHTCAIASDDQAYCWGNNSAGQLGNNSTTSSKVPVAVNTAGVLSGKTIKSITAGDDHTCAIASDDQSYCWGLNNSGQLGNNSTTNSKVPVAVNTAGVLSGKTIKSITAGDGHTCVIASDDLTYCWGNNSAGQLGNNSTTNSKVPVAVNTAGVLSGKTIKSITAGDGHTCVIASDDLTYCWGNNSAGQLGNNSTTNSKVPVAVNTAGVLSGKTIKSITAGGGHTCVIASDDLTYCWGNNISGQLGNNSYNSSHTPISSNYYKIIKSLNSRAVSAGLLHTCAVASDGQAYCWGYNYHGQLGDINDGSDSNIPIAVDTAGVLAGKTIKSITAGYYHTCAIASDDQAYCWGNNDYGQSGDGNYVPGAVNTTGVLAGKTIKSITAGESYTCAIASDDQAYCWGNNSAGQLGNNSTTDSSVPVAVNTTGVLSGKTIKSITAGSNHTCAIASDDQSYCWGYNEYGQLGNNSTTNSKVPVAVDTGGVLSGKTIRSISAGYYHTCAIASDDQSYCWGNNSAGQLGNNSTTDSSVPVAVNTTGVLSGKTIKSITAGSNHTCAIASDDQSYCWGLNNSGQLGNNSTTNSKVPVAVDTGGVLSGKTIRSISAGYYHTCAIASDDQSYCWGNNSAGQLGNNSTTDSSVPVAVNTTGVLSGKTIKSITAGSNHTCAIASDDQSYCWGYNEYGQLGNNSNTNSYQPVDNGLQEMTIYVNIIYLDNILIIPSIKQYRSGKYGSLISNVIDVDPGGVYYGNIQISSNPDNELDKIKIQIRTDDIADMSDASDWISCNLLSDGADIKTSNCINVSQRYLQYRILISNDENENIKVNNLVFEYNVDNTSPVLPEDATIIVKTSPTGRAITNNQWSNSVLPYVSWTPATDTDGSGVAGYCLYYGESDTPDFSQTSGYLMDSVSQIPSASSLCQYATANTSIDLADIISASSVSAISAGTKLNLFVKPFDYVLNDTSTSLTTSFRIDLVEPQNDTIFNGPTGIVNSKKFDINWIDKPENNISPYDANSGAFGFKYCVIRLTEGNYSDCDSASDPYWTGPSGNIGSINDSNFTDVYEISDGKITTNINDPKIDTNGTNILKFALLDNAGNYDINGNGAMSMVTVSQQSASIPTNLTAIPDPVNPLSNNFSFSWDPPAVYQGPSADINYCYTVNEIIKADTSNCHWTGGGVLSLPAGAYATQQGNNTLYLMAKDQAGNYDADEVAEVIFKTNTTAPGIPEYVSIADVSTKLSSDWKLALSWAKPAVGYENITTYRIYRSTDGVTFGAEPVGQTSQTTFSYTDSGLTQQTYYYKVLACDNASSCSFDSDIVSALPTGKFTVPANLIDGSDGIKDIGTKKATIYWITDRDSDSFVKYGTTSGNYFKDKVGDTTQTSEHSINLTNLSPGTTYYYQTQWTDKDDNIGTSLEKSFTTLAAPSISEVSVSQINVSGGTINFSIENATKLNVYYGQTESFGGAKSINTSFAKSTYSIALSDLDDGTKYYYKLNGFDADGNEYAGNIYSFVTLPRPKISNLRFQPVAGASSNTTKVSWTTNVPANSGLSYAVIGNPATEVISSNLTTNHEITISGLQDDKNYSLIARSRDALGNLAISDTQTFRTALDTRPPVISEAVVESSIKGSGSEARGQVIVSWSTDEPATSQVAYGQGAPGDYSNKTSEDSRLSNEHVVIISDLSTSSIFQIRLLSKDKSGNYAYGTNKSVIIGRGTENVFTIIFNSLRKIFGIKG